jgi:hypothetical protein
MYLARSRDGITFSKPEKLGTGTWKLNACPMDGGALALLNNRVVTVWRRGHDIFLASPGEKEERFGTGRNAPKDSNRGALPPAPAHLGSSLCGLRPIVHLGLQLSPAWDASLQFVETNQAAATPYRRQQEPEHLPLSDSARSVKCTQRKLLRPRKMIPYLFRQRGSVATQLSVSTGSCPRVLRVHNLRRQGHRNSSKHSWLPNRPSFPHPDNPTFQICWLEL